MAPKLTTYLLTALNAQFPFLKDWQPLIQSERQQVTFDTARTFPQDLLWKCDEGEVVVLHFYNDSGFITNRSLSSDGLTPEEVVPLGTKYILAMRMKETEGEKPPLHWTLFPFDSESLSQAATAQARIMHQRVMGTVPSS